MKKRYILTITVIIFLIIILPKDSNQFRIRVIASSNSLTDQQDKMLVVATVQQYLNKIEAPLTASKIIKSVDILEEEISSILNGKDISIQIKKTRFPNKNINGEVIPGGNYDTLLIVIGEGTGRNWWSILYPDFHNISFDDNDSDDIIYKSYIWEKIKNLLFIK